MRLGRVGVLALTATLAACAGHPQKPTPTSGHVTIHAPPTPPPRKPWKPLGPYTPGGLYAPGVADGEPDVPPDVANLQEPVPHAEPHSRYGNRSPYVVLGKTYTVLPSAKGYNERGIASWYGTKFDGRATSNFESYDVYQFSAAHRTLPLPSFARVTNLDNGRSVIVRVNDRGPFHDGRLIDLSYAAAVKLGVTAHGTARVEVRGIDPGAPLPPPPEVAQVAPPAPTRTKVAPAPNPGSRPAPPVASAPLKPPAPGVQTTPLAGTTVIAAAAIEPLPVAIASSVQATQNPTSSPLLNSKPSPSMLPSNPPTAMPETLVPTQGATPLVQSVIGRPPIDAATYGFLQLASYGNRANAEIMLRRLQQAGIDHAELVSVQVAGQSLWRVHVGPLQANEAESVADRLDTLGFGHPPFFKN